MQLEDTTFSAYGGLAIIGHWMRRHKVWARVEKTVKIKQKTVVHTPHEKLLDALIHILSGAERMVTLNTELRVDEGLQRAFGRTTCAEQSGVSTTLDRCDEQTLEQMQAVQTQLIRKYGRAARHRFKHKWLILDVDTSGILCGKQGEGSEKGYYSAKKGGVVAKLGVLSLLNMERL